MYPSVSKLYRASAGSAQDSAGNEIGYTDDIQFVPAWAISFHNRSFDWQDRVPSDRCEKDIQNSRGEPRKPRGKVCTSLYKQEVSVQTQYLVRLNAIPEEIDRDMNGRRIR